MDDEVVGINNGKLVIRVVTCMIMIRSYILRFSRCTSCCWCIRNQMGEGAVHKEYNGTQPNGVREGNIHFLPNFRFFGGNFTLFLNFHSFSNGQTARKPRSVTFSSITMCKSRFFSTKKKRKEKVILGAKTRFCGNRYLYSIFQHKTYSYIDIAE